MPLSVTEMSYAMSRVVAERTAKTLPRMKATQRKVVVGHLLVAGKTREKARNATGINDAVTKATRPQTSV